MNRQEGIRKIVGGIIGVIMIFGVIPPSAFASEANPWKSNTSLPYDLASHSAYYFNGKIFVVGGAVGPAIPGYLFSDIGNNGDLAPWLSSGVSATVYWQASTIKNNFYYILGGTTGGESLNTVLLGKMQDNGTVASLMALNSLPKALALGAAATVNDTLFYAGGFTIEDGEQRVSRSIYKSHINADGTIGSWSEAGLLPDSLYGFGMIENANHILIIGGTNPEGEFSAKTYLAPVNTDGSLGSWQETSVLPEAIYRAGISKSGTTLLVVGGGNPSPLDKVYFTQLNSDGTVGEWKLSPYRLPQPICCGALVTSPEYIYVIGGYNPSADTYLNTVYSAPLASIIPGMLTVPYFSQNALPWGTQEYDHTKSLKAANTSMDRWGCAVTSVAMVLRYYGITEMPDGKQVDPESLNNWLKNNNGYFYGTGKDGWYSAISFPAITKLAMNLYSAGKSPIKLMYERHLPDPSTNQLLTDDLTTQKIPAILFVSNAVTDGHFVVAKGINEHSYAINDPEWNYTSLTAFNNTYKHLDRYIPSHTNLSYINIVVNPDIEILVTDPDGHKSGKQLIDGKTQSYNDIAGATYSFESPLSNPDKNGKKESLGTGYNEFLLPTPKNGRYTLTFSGGGSKNYQANLALYQTNGTNTVGKIEGIVGRNQPEKLIIDYFQEKASQTTRIITFESTIADINELHDANFLTNTAVAKSFVMIVKEAQGSYKAGRKSIEKETLRVFINALKELNGKVMNSTAYRTLLEDATYLKENY